MKKLLINPLSRLGFSMIELLIVISIIGVIATISTVGFNFQESPLVFKSNVSEVANFLSAVRSKSISQVKPDICAGYPLDGYQVAVTSGGRDYQSQVICGGVHVVAQKSLPSGFSFAAGSAITVKFDVATGTVSNPGSILVSGQGRTSTITIDKLGNISVRP